MTSVHKYSPFAQLIICLGLFIVITLGFSMLMMGYILPNVFGISAITFSRGDLSDPHLLHVMKIFQMLYSIFSFFLPAFIFFMIWHKKPFRFAGLTSKFHWGWMLAGVLILFISLPFVGILSDWNQHIHFGALDETFRTMQKRAQEMVKAMLNMPDVKHLWFDLLLIAVIPAIAEEFFFRGAIQRILIKLTHRAWIGILLTAIFFSLVHGEMLGFFPRVALGLILGLVYFFSGNLWYAVIIHFVNNAFQVVVIYLHQHQWIKFDVTQNTPTPVYMGIISLILIIGAFWIYQKKIPENPNKHLWEG